jgi:hypothetical protein
MSLNDSMSATVESTEGLEKLHFEHTRDETLITNLS